MCASEMAVAATRFLINYSSTGNCTSGDEIKGGSFFPGHGFDSCKVHLYHLPFKMEFLFQGVQ